MSNEQNRRGDGDQDRMTQTLVRLGSEHEHEENRLANTGHQTQDVEVQANDRNMAIAGSPKQPTDTSGLDSSGRLSSRNGNIHTSQVMSNVVQDRFAGPKFAEVSAKKEVPVESTPDETMDQEKTSPVPLKVQFEDFAAQLRLHRHHEHRQRMLQHRRRNLQTALALSTRLHRVGSWIHDGLVEISRYSDATGFVRVQQHMQELTDVCFSHWDRQIQAFDAVNVTELDQFIPAETQSFLGKLSDIAKNDCLELIHTLRSNPRFLVERLKSMSASQVAALSTPPKYQKLSDSVLKSLSDNRSRASQRKRIEAFSKGLEDYASSFERSNSLSFLLHHIFGPTHDGTHAESQLRLSTWSTICADLFHESSQNFGVLINQVFNGFANSHVWKMKDRIELFLMDVLQRGAFLLESVENEKSEFSFNTYIPDSLNTEGANEFFDQAVIELFAILAHQEGGFPIAARELGRATIGRIPTPEQQGAFRGYFLQWFLSEYLRIAITYPENEKMLLQYHISENARTNILHELWRRAATQATESLYKEPTNEIEKDIQFLVGALVGQLTPLEPCVDPYSSSQDESSLRRQERGANDQASFISICAPDVVHVLEALRPQFINASGHWGLLMSSSQSTFNSQYSRASNKFDRLRNEILLNTEPGSSTKNIHPCQEQWVTLVLDSHGHPNLSLSKLQIQNTIRRAIMADLGVLNKSQEAAVRLFWDGDNYHTSVPSRSSVKAYTGLSDIFLENAKLAAIRLDSVDALYWRQAHTYTCENYRIAMLTQNDMRILWPLMKLSQSASRECHLSCDRLEDQISSLQDAYANTRAMILLSRLRLDKLRVKMWYSADVLTSQAYDEAKNVCAALTHMALKAPGAMVNGSRSMSDRRRPSTSTSVSSTFDQPRFDTLGILKASSEHGGSTKLADGQIEMIRKWLKRNSVDNFCKGEERIHRFCMEVKMATRRLIGDSLAESPVLWSSGLFAKEKNLFEAGGIPTFSVPGSTRPPSVMSETLSSGFYSTRPSLRNVEVSSRSVGSEDQDLPVRKPSFHSLGSSSRISRDFLGSDVASSFGSPGRATTATTPETVSSVWSPHQPYSRSMTSASIYSRPSSTYNEFAIVRVPDSGRDRAKFLEALQEQLTCLLLSDLGCPLWSYGSETDSWMKSIRLVSSIDRRLQERQLVAKLMSDPKGQKGKSRESATQYNVRRQSAPTKFTRSRSSPRSGKLLPHSQADTMQVSSLLDGMGFVYPDDDAFQDVLDRVSQQADPALKLQAIYDFKVLALSSLKFKFKANYNQSKSSQIWNNQEHLDNRGRRKSLDSKIGSSTASNTTNGGKSEDDTTKHAAIQSEPTENEIIECLTAFLLALKPKTLFRDLQYIAAFVPLDTLNKTESGKAFLQVGLAALASKDEVCRSMVDVADRMVARDVIKRRISTEETEPIIKAADYWMFAAREGNAIAQRELASLYLTHPEVLPVVSLPLSLSADTFKTGITWKENGVEGMSEKGKNQTLCLALHWMQQAANNGDEIAGRKLQEMKETYSIR